MTGHASWLANMIRHIKDTLVLHQCVSYTGGLVNSCRVTIEYNNYHVSN